MLNLSFHIRQVLKPLILNKNIFAFTYTLLNIELKQAVF